MQRRRESLVKEVFGIYKEIWDTRIIPHDVDARTHANEFVDEMNTIYLRRWLMSDDLRLSKLAAMSYMAMIMPEFSDYSLVRMQYSRQAIARRSTYAKMARCLDLVEEELKERFRQEIERLRRGQRKRRAKRLEKSKNGM